MDTNKKDENHDDNVGITIVPSDLVKIERYDDEGSEHLEKSWTSEELFARSVAEVETNFKNTTSDDNDHHVLEKSYKIDPHNENRDLTWMDPRIHYRPMVTSLQASSAELHQLVNVIDLMRGKEFLDETYCIREDTLPKSNDLSVLIETKSRQMKEAAQILRTGSVSMKQAVAKERRFFKSVLHLLKKWNLCVPRHGIIPKPFRADAALAIDLSFDTAGSSTGSVELSDIASASIDRTARYGVAIIKPPVAHVAQTLQVEIIDNELMTTGVHTMAGYVFPSHTRDELEEMEASIEMEENDNGSESVNAAINDANDTILSSVQHSVLCHEILRIVTQEALNGTTNWSNDVMSSTGDVTVIHVMDNEVSLRLNATTVITIRLVEQPNVAKSSSTSVVLQQAAVLACQLLHTKTLNSFSRHDNATSLKVFSTNTSTNDVLSHNVLQSTLATIGHKLLVQQIESVLDVISASVARGRENTTTSALWQHHESFLPGPVTLPICDTCHGIYLKARWKNSDRIDMTEVRLSIGKYFETDVLISGLEITFSCGNISHYGPTPPRSTTVNNIEEFKARVIDLILVNVTEMLYRHVKALGVSRVLMDADHKSIKILAASDWDGTGFGERKVSGDKDRGCIVLRPKKNDDDDNDRHCVIDIECTLQCLGAIPALDNISTPTTSTSSNTFNLDWSVIPVSHEDDASKIKWVIEKVGRIPMGVHITE